LLALGLGDAVTHQIPADRRHEFGVNVVRVILVLLAGGLMVQVVVVAKVALFHVHSRDGRQLPPAYTAVARRMADHPHAPYAQTSQDAALRYAVYPHVQADIHFRDMSASRVESELRSHRVRYIVVVPPNEPPFLRGTAAWYHPLIDRPNIRLLEVAR
jgi:hypothetical protein